jgi:hypothetical protein
MTPFRKLSAATIESLLSEHSVPDAEFSEDIHHFIRLLENCPKLRRVVETWTGQASRDACVTELFALSFWLGYQCRYTLAENERLESLLQ